MNVSDIRRAHDQAAKEFVDQGKLIEAGWAGLKATWLAPDAPAHQAKALRYAFMAGAQHVFASIMSVLEAGEEPTDADLRRMDLIATELATFYEEVQRDLPTGGQA